MVYHKRFYGIQICIVVILVVVVCQREMSILQFLPLGLVNEYICACRFRVQIIFFNLSMCYSLYVIMCHSVIIIPLSVSPVWWSRLFVLNQPLSVVIHCHEY